MKVIGDVDH